MKAVLNARRITGIVGVIVTGVASRSGGVLRKLSTLDYILATIKHLASAHGTQPLFTPRTSKYGTNPIFTITCID